MAAIPMQGMMHSRYHNQRGTTMIEVLVTFIVMAIGLFGVVGMEAKLQNTEMEAYQRTQALMLLDDMSNRLTANRNNVSSYLVAPANPVGNGMTCPTSTTTRAQSDMTEWCNSLQGVGESVGGSKVGVMVGARGCIQDLGSSQYMITVAWQGFTPISAPPTSVACGASLYNNTSNCTNDSCRRVVTRVVQITAL